MCKKNCKAIRNQKEKGACYHARMKAKCNCYIDCTKFSSSGKKRCLSAQVKLGCPSKGSMPASEKASKSKSSQGAQQRLEQAAKIVSQRKKEEREKKIEEAN